jgi:hypothetical protein
MRTSFRSCWLPIGSNFETIAKCWLYNIKFGIVNMVTSTVCWGAWKLRNSLHFQGLA